MKPKVIVVILLVVATLGGWWMFSNSAERKIQRLFTQVSSEIHKSGPEPPFTELAKAKALAMHVGPRLRIEGLDSGREFTIDHSNLPQQIALFRRELQTFSIEFDQLTVKVANDGTAQAFCNATCFNMPEWVSESNKWVLTATLEKDATGDWRFTILHFAPLIP